MSEITWIIDGTTGDLTVEGIPQSELRHWTGDVLPDGKSLNCARPLNSPPISNVRAPIEDGAPALRVFRIYHNSVIEGPGRRSVVQLSGCKQNCPGCFVPETHPVDAGVEMSVVEVVSQLLDPQGAPRDGVTILGGEPFLQPDGLLLLVQTLKAHNEHVTVYSGYTLEQLHTSREDVIRRILELTDILIDGPFVQALSSDAQEWRGSTNQRIIHRPAVFFSEIDAAH